MVSLLHSVGLPPGPENNVTTIAPDWIELRCAPPRREEDVKDERTNIDNIVEQKSVIRCSNCGDPGHYSLSCPKRRELGPQADAPPPRGSESTFCFVLLLLQDVITSLSLPTFLKLLSSFHSRSLTHSLACLVSSRLVSSLLPLLFFFLSDAGKYVPVFLRGTSEREEESSLRISNLPEETTEFELKQLLLTISRKQNIDMPSRVFLVMDRNNPEISRGFAFVTYSSAKDAKIAQSTIDGYRFNTMVLEAEFSAAREDRPRGGGGGGKDRGSRGEAFEERATKDFAVSRPWRSK